MNRSKLAMSNKEKLQEKLLHLKRTGRRLSFGFGVYLHLNKQESEAKTSREVRQDPDIKSVRVCKYIVARIYREYVLGVRRSDRDEKRRAEWKRRGGGFVTVHRYREYVPKTVNGVRTNPPDNRRGDASDDLPVIGVPCNRQVCR